MLRISIIILFIICTNVSYSQDTISLDPISISASLKPLRVSETGRNIIIVKGETFAKLAVHSVDELLRYVPGIEVQTRGPFGSQSDIVIRGGTFQQVLVVLDGLRLNDPNSGHFTSYIPIAPEEIDRIEIVKGASAAIYGSEAVGGVIHIISKSFAAKNNEAKKNLNLVATGGEYGLWSGNAGGTYQKKHTVISGGVISNNADGQPQRGTTGYFNNNTVSLSAGHYFNDHLKLSVRSAFDKRRFSAQNFYTTFKSDTAHEAVRSLWNQLNLTYEKNKDKFSVDAGYKNVKDEYTFNSAGTPNRNTSTLLQLLGLYQRGILTTGVQFQNKYIRSNDRGDHHSDQIAAFIILDKAFGKLKVTPAIRIDHTVTTEVVPQINLSYRSNTIQLRGSAGKTIRQADFTERYNNYNKTLVTSGSIGNPDLEAERSFSYEAGADLFLKFIKISATAFKRDQQKLIDWTPTPYSQMPRKINLSPAGNYALANNIAKVNTKGIEMDVQFTKPISISEKIWATLGVVWLDSKGSDTVPSFYISSHAKFMSNFSILYERKNFAVSVNGVYKKRKVQFAPAINANIDAECFMLNSKIEVSLIKHKLGVFAEVDNIFDNTCGDLLGAQMPGRWLMGGIKLSIQ